MITPESSEPAPENTTSEGADAAGQILAALAELAANQSAVNAALAELAANQSAVNAALAELAANQGAVNDEVLKRLDRHDRRFERMDQHLGYLRGAHAANVAQRNASLIADDMGYQIIAQLPREELIGLSKIAHDRGKPDSDVRSFRNADLVMLVKDDNGHPAYIAVEASFTVGAKDIERAKRNADYLCEFTGLPAKGAVASVEIPSGRLRNADAVGVHCYTIPVKDLEAE